MVVILISANAEWEVVCDYFPQQTYFQSPYGEWFYYPPIGYPCREYPSKENPHPWILFHGGWGKISAAGSTQYVIDRWHPKLLINLGTCGGFAGKINRFQTVLADRTVVYDIYEQMGDPEAHTNFYTTRLESDWFFRELPHPVQIGTLVSADRDLFPEQLPGLLEKYQARAGDWESGAIAFIAHRNQIEPVILRGVTDLVGVEGGEAYQNNTLYIETTKIVMKNLLDQLPDWIFFILGNMPSD